MLGFILLSYDL